MGKKIQNVHRQNDRDRKEVDQAKIELEWRAIKELHTEKVWEWEVECTRLAAESILKKKLPKKPVCPLKPKGPQAQSRNAGAPEGKEQSDSSLSSEADNNE